VVVCCVSFEITTTPLHLSPFPSLLLTHTHTHTQKHTHLRVYVPWCVIFTHTHTQTHTHTHAHTHTNTRLLLCLVQTLTRELEDREEQFTGSNKKCMGLESWTAPLTRDHRVSIKE